jgi:hypothetical protein
MYITEFRTGYSGGKKSNEISKFIVGSEKRRVSDPRRSEERL